MTAQILRLSQYRTPGVAAQLAQAMERDPAKIARQVQAFAPIPPQSEYDEPVNPINGPVVLICAAVIFMLPIAMYWMVLLGGAVVRLTLGVAG